MNEVDDSGVFSGYASTFGNVDLGGELVEAGAFTQTLIESGGKIPLLDHHDPTRQIGWNLEAREDQHGLFVRGRLNLEVQAGREKHALMRQAAQVGARMGLSIGFRTLRDEADANDPRIRRLKEIELMEYSVVTFPMNPQATVTGLKHQDASFEALKQSLKQLTKHFLS
ncbi:MAG: HK97 family phage prohead protease [Candidatus Nitrohelix vancouverensis]|uniref:HK97 family phage prohead protease n=1 Tax=Candidatus Nitrohelix vancouverensis TaxID=2705534 RepID=A0A7T0C535_9BACT|nr:MAG: HK97 family phage prohead protease [Candidatus Nitrohelix vancouverensis]